MEKILVKTPAINRTGDNVAWRLVLKAQYSPDGQVRQFIRHRQYFYTDGGMAYEGGSYYLVRTLAGVPYTAQEVFAQAYAYFLEKVSSELKDNRIAPARWQQAAHDWDVCNPDAQGWVDFTS